MGLPPFENLVYDKINVWTKKNDIPKGIGLPKKFESVFENWVLLTLSDDEKNFLMKQDIITANGKFTNFCILMFERIQDFC